MARAMTAGELAKIRADGQHSRLYLGILAPAMMLEAQVNGAPTSNDRVVELTIDGASWGSGYSSAPAGALVYVGSSQGAYDKGMVRLRSALSGTPTSMDVGEISEIDWADDDYLTVVDEFPLAPKHVYIDANSVVYMDYEVTYGEQHAYPDPVPVLGPAFTPVWLTGATVDVDFDGSDSWALDGGAVTYAWSAPGASATSGMATATPTITYDAAGTYRVSCVVSRNYGGGKIKTATGYRMVRVYDSNDMPVTQFVLDDCSGSWQQGGWSFRVTLFDEAAQSSVRDRALVCLFAKDWYGGVEGSIGPVTDRENIVALGWIASESITWDPELASVSFEVQGPQWWLDQMEGFPSGLEDTQSAPTAWTEFEDLTLDKGLWHFAHFRSTLTAVLDLQLTGDTRGISIFNAALGTLWEQISGNAQATILAQPCADRFGRLFVEVEPQLVPTGDRGTIPTVQTVQAQDLRRPLTLERATTPRVGLVDLSGIIFSAGAGTPTFSLAPGHIPKWLGGGIESADRLALADQSQANELAGLVLGWRNNRYPDVPLSLASNQRMVDVCPHQYLDLSIAAGDTPRSLAIALTLTPRAVSFDYNPRSGQLTTDVRAEATTVDESAIDGDVPEAPPEPYDPPDIPIEPPPIPPTEATGDAVVIGTRGAGICYTLDAVSGSPPTWYQLNTGLANTSVIYDLCKDPQQQSSHLACIDGSLECYINTGWRTGAAWGLAFSQADAQALYPAGGGVTLVSVDAFQQGTQTYLVVVAQFAAGLGVTRVFVSADWGTTWEMWPLVVANYSIWGVSSLCTFYQSAKWWSGMGSALGCMGQLVLYGGFVVMGGRGAGSQGRSNLASHQIGDPLASWNEPCYIPVGADPSCSCSGASILDGNSTGDTYAGGDYLFGGPGAMCLAPDGSVVYIANWVPHYDYDNSRPLYLAQLNSDETITPLVTVSEDWGHRKGMLVTAPVGSGEHYVGIGVIGVSTRSTEVYVGTAGSMTKMATVGIPCRAVEAFPVLVGDDDEAVLYLGRSYQTAGPDERAIAGDEELFYVSKRPPASMGSYWEESSGNLFDLGAQSVTRIVVDAQMDR